jgi:3-oxoacyl-[acyl-carrier protein] reductase
MISLRGKHALVTGGSRGIGAETAVLLAECGADVGIGFRSREGEAAEVVKRIADRGVRSFAQSSDLTAPSGADALFERAVREFGGLDIVVGNAGTWPADEARVGEMSDDRWRKTLMHNLDAAFHTARAAARVLGQGGRLVLVSSTAGQRGEAFHADYAAAKGATVAFVKSLAIELAPRDITVNSVAPGWVDTEMVADVMGNGGRERIAASIPLGRIASARDIAGPIVFLCSDEARHITGEILNVNGGSVLCG